MNQKPQEYVNKAMVVQMSGLVFAYPIKAQFKFEACLIKVFLIYIQCFAENPMKTVRTLIRCHKISQIWVCTVCLSSKIWTAGLSYFLLVLNQTFSDHHHIQVCEYKYSLP